MASKQDRAVSLGLQSMDLTHREFVERLVAFEQVTDGELKTRFADIVRHTMDHFRREDECMRRLDYAHAEAHTEEHDKVLKVMTAVTHCVEKGDTRFGRILIREIATWFHDHAMTMDAMLARFLAATGHGPVGPEEFRGGSSESARQ